MGKNSKVFQTAFGDYSVLSQIGEGGSGIVYRVQDEQGREAALKLVRSKEVDRQKLKRFRNELMFCLKNTHRNIIKVLDWGFEQEADHRRPFYVMPYFPSTLRQHIEEGIKPERVLPLFSEMLDGVECAHLQDVFHRDLKPENILIDERTQSVVIADFGVAHFSEELLVTEIKTRPHDRLANFQYAAPEQRKKGLNVTHKADIYSLGLILNEMFTGQVPIGTDFKKIKTVSKDYAWVDEVVDKMLRQSQESRLASIKTIKDEMVGRGNDFVIQQRLDQLRMQVVPESEISDPLVVDPPQPVGIDYRENELVIKLSQTPNTNWAGLFQQVNFGHAPANLVPERFRFFENEARVQCAEQNAPQAYEEFKRYLPMAVANYKAYVLAQVRKYEEEEKRRLRNEIEQEERRQRVRGSIQL